MKRYELRGNLYTINELSEMSGIAPATLRVILSIVLLDHSLSTIVWKSSVPLVGGMIGLVCP